MMCFFSGVCPMPLRCLLLCILHTHLSVGLLPSLSAQSDPPLRPGSHIEIVSAEIPSGIGVGYLMSLSRDSLTYSDTVAVRTISLESIGQLRVNIGRDKASLNMVTLLGALMGATLGPMLFSESGDCDSAFRRSDDCGSELPTALVDGLLTAGVMRVIAGFGLEERWVNVRMDRLLYGEGRANQPRKGRNSSRSPLEEDVRSDQDIQGGSSHGPSPPQQGPAEGSIPQAPPPHCGIGGGELSPRLTMKPAPPPMMRSMRPPHSGHSVRAGSDMF